jgi:glycosyltransferase involved in cell wall biosynthesis
MKSDPILSIVTVVFNDLEALKKTVQSVVELEFKNFEYIIIDGGSTDGTLEYIYSITNNSVRCLSEKDDGIFDAFNKGINLSTGLWVHLLNAGDIYMDKNVFANVNFDSEKDFICFPVLKRKKKDYVWKPELFYENIFVNVSHPGLLVKRIFYKTSEMYPVNFKYVSDSYFIWNNVVPEKSLIHETTLVEMADGGYSTKWKLQHEIEKQSLIFLSKLSLVNRLKLHIKYFLAGMLKFFLMLKDRF